MTFPIGTLVGFKLPFGTIIYGNIGIPASGNAKGRFYVHLKEKNVRGQHLVLPPLSSLFIPDKVKCECGEECENTGMYSRDDMTEGLTCTGEMWFHPDCIDREHPDDFNYCQTCNVLCFCDDCETLQFDDALYDYCPTCWMEVSEEDRKEGREDIE